MFMRIARVSLDVDQTTVLLHLDLVRMLIAALKQHWVILIIVRLKIIVESMREIAMHIMNVRLVLSVVMKIVILPLTSFLMNRIAVTVQ